MILCVFGSARINHSSVIKEHKSLSFNFQIWLYKTIPDSSPFHSPLHIDNYYSFTPTSSQYVHFYHCPCCYFCFCSFMQVSKRKSTKAASHQVDSPSFLLLMSYLLAPYTAVYQSSDADPSALLLLKGHVLALELVHVLTALQRKSHLHARE